MLLSSQRPPCIAAEPNRARDDIRSVASSNVRLFRWDRGVAVRRREYPPLAMFLRFYEWNLFDAVKRGQITKGNESLRSVVNPTGTRATIDSPELSLQMTGCQDGVDLLLTVTNQSAHDWPEIASIIPCYNPGPPHADERTEAFVNQNTYYLCDRGLRRLQKREIRFHRQLRPFIDAARKDGEFEFSHKWPTGGVDVTSGALIRESTDATWVTAIAWDDFLSVQGHNEWNCMHLSVRVGPLKAGGTKQIRGKIYLFPGTKTECLERIRGDLGIAYNG